jgi:hypothetical protein
VHKKFIKIAKAEFFPPPRLSNLYELFIPALRAAVSNQADRILSGRETK